VEKKEKEKEKIKFIRNCLRGVKESEKKFDFFSLSLPLCLSFYLSIHIHTDTQNNGATKI
jgi:hypothetical protein